MNATDLQKLIDWLMDGARSARTPVALLSQTCERLVDAGLPLWRSAAFVQTLHSDAFGRSFV
jgi:adenylate cyclase